MKQGKFTSSISSSGVGSVSSGVLGDSSGSCKPVILGGSYSPGTALSTSNTVQLEVTVAVPGSYTISSNTANGISFAKSGTFTATGLQTVILTGNGTPITSGTQNFIVTYGNSQCTFAINFGSSAVSTLGGNGGNCAPFAIGGIYQQGILLNQTNTVQLQVTVVTPGNYTISTDTVNGISFTNSGTFNNTGLQIITLAGQGTPVNTGIKNFVEHGRAAWMERW